MKIEWARRIAGVENPAVKNILKITQRTDVISFAGGLPSAASFPVREITNAFESVLAEQGAAALQYGVTEGYGPLREWVAEWVKKFGISCTAANVLITNGSQQVLDLAARTMINPGDYIALENPTYLAAVQAFKGSEARFLPITMDEHGIRVDALAQAVRKTRPKFIYVIPTFHNPTGVTMSLERRKQLAELAAEQEIPILEDNPYGELRYGGEDVPAVKSLARNGGVVMYAGTVSKIIAPGLRIGWVIADAEIIDKMASVKQSSDVLTNSLTQRAVHRYVTEYDLEAQIAQIVRQYREQRDVMIAAMEENFPAGVSWQVPDGGMFVWVVLPESVDTNKLLPKAIEKKVAFVPGSPFYADDSGRNTMRLNFSNATPEVIKEGMARLGQLLREELK